MNDIITMYLIGHISLNYLLKAMHIFQFPYSKDNVWKMRGKWETKLRVLRKNMRKKKILQKSQTTNTVRKFGQNSNCEVSSIKSDDIFALHIYSKSNNLTNKKSNKYT